MDNAELDFEADKAFDPQRGDLWKDIQPGHLGLCVEVVRVSKDRKRVFYRWAGTKEMRAKPLSNFRECFQFRSPRGDNGRS